MTLFDKFKKWIDNSLFIDFMIETLGGLIMCGVVLGITFLAAYIFNLLGFDIENSVIIFALLFIIFTALTVLAYFLIKKITHKP